jgi:hypothetical protein
MEVAHSNKMIRLISFMIDNEKLGWALLYSISLHLLLELMFIIEKMEMFFIAAAA